MVVVLILLRTYTRVVYGRFRFSENLLKKLDEELMNVLNDHKRKLKEKDEDIMKVSARYD